MDKVRQLGHRIKVIRCDILVGYRNRKLILDKHNNLHYVHRIDDAVLQEGCIVGIGKSIVVIEDIFSDIRADGSVDSIVVHRPHFDEKGLFLHLSAQRLQANIQPDLIVEKSDISIFKYVIIDPGLKAHLRKACFRQYINRFAGKSGYPRTILSPYPPAPKACQAGTSRS